MILKIKIWFFKQLKKEVINDNNDYSSLIIRFCNIKIIQLKKSKR
jgi:hypothetical protein